ncbi:hypothetical protein BH18ACT14_BH18ACT14_18170 [soil metagenome]
MSEDRNRGIAPALQCVDCSSYAGSFRSRHHRRFAGTVYFAGEQMGIWDPIDPPPPSSQAPVTGTDEGKGKKKKKKKKKSRSGSASAAKKRWTRCANALCRRAERETSRLKWPTTSEQAQSLIERLAVINARYQAALASLKVVKADRAKFRKVLALFVKDERLIDEYLSALRNQQAPRSFLDVLQRLSASADKESIVLYKLGATRCAAGFAVPYF